MAKVLVVTGSVRPNSVNHKVVELVKNSIETREGSEVQIADLGELNLPFFDAQMPPSADEYEIQNEAVRVWSDLVKGADYVVLVSPEYNHSLSAIQKNAIDWLFDEWVDKPIAFVAYGWYAGVNSLAQLKEIGSVIKWRAIDEPAGLKFMEDIDLSGAVIDGGQAKAKIVEAVDQLVVAE
jgi:NAD(P)H-dependent FMN reductase